MPALTEKSLASTLTLVPMMSMPAGVMVIMLLPSTSVMLDGFSRIVVVPTTSWMVVGVIAWMPAGDIMIVLCGPVGDGGDGSTSGAVGAVWMVTEGGTSVNTIWLPAMVRIARI